jgi:hypothetical protein
MSTISNHLKNIIITSTYKTLNESVELGNFYKVVEKLEGEVDNFVVSLDKTSSKADELLCLSSTKKNTNDIPKALSLRSVVSLDYLSLKTLLK